MTSVANRVRYARRKADAIGLHLVGNSGVIDLLADGERVHRGDIDSVEAYLAQRCPDRRRPRRREPAAWTPIIDDYMLTLAAAGRPVTSTKLRRIQLARMARELDTPPADITGEQLVAWFGSHTEWKAETRRSERSAARGFLIWAYRTKRIPHHIADELPKIRQPKASPRPTPDQAWRLALLKADPRTTLMLRLAAEVGMRRSEVAQVHTRDLIEGDGAQLLVRGKGNKQRIVPISDALAHAIRSGPAGHTPGAPGHGWLFPDPRGIAPLTPGYVGTLVAAALPDGWTMHTLRHRCASRAYRGTRNLRAVQMLLGHESIATTERYTAVDNDEIRAAMAAAVGD